MAIKRRDDRVRLDTILKESTRRKRVLSEYYSGGLGVRELALSLDKGMKLVLVYTALYNMRFTKITSKGGTVIIGKI